MAQFFIDEQFSQVSPVEGQISLNITATPTLIGTLGLVTDFVGPNLRVELDVTVNLVFQSSASVLVQVVRGVGIGSPVVLASNITIPVGASAFVLPYTVSGVDFLPPNPGFLTYQAFVSLSSPGVPPILPARVGPETLRARAFSDFPV